MAGSMSANSVAIRPLDKGMILDKPSQLIPDGGFYRLKNFISTVTGPKRRPGFTQFAAADTAPDPYVDYLTIWRVDGSQISVLITERYLYVVNPLSGYTRVDWKYTGPAKASVTGATLTAPSANFTTAGVLVGDVVEIGTYSGVVSSVTSATELVMVDTDIPDGSNYDYLVRYTFKPGNARLPDWTIFSGELLIADGKHPLLHYDPVLNTMAFWTTDAGKKLPGGVDFVPACVTSFADRVVCGYTSDSIDGVQRQRIRWSSLADPTDFSLTTAYLDLPYVNGAVRRLVPLSNTLIAYFDDALYMGIQTNSPLFPFRFDLVDTGGIGLVGSKAISSFTGGHFFIGQDDIYFLTTQGAQRIGSPVVRESIRVCQVPERCYVAMNPWDTCVVFGFPITNQYMENLWYFDYKGKGWSYADIATYMISNPVVNTTITWDDLTGTWDTLVNTYPEWDSIKLDDPRKFLIIEMSSSLWKGTENGDLDFGTNAIQAILITKDHDFDLPDELKTFVRLGIKIDVETTLINPVIYQVEISINRGKTWKSCGTLTIPITKDEGYVNFRAMGSTVTFRLTSSSQVESYSITEYVIKARVHGSERDTSTQV